MKSQLLVWGAGQIIHFSGQVSVTSTFYPMRLYKSHLQIFFHMSTLSPLPPLLLYSSITARSPDPPAHLFEPRTSRASPYSKL